MSTAPITFGGLESGLNTSSIIAAEMTKYSAPLTALQAQQSNLNTEISDYQAINSQLLALQQAAGALSSPVAFNEAYAATSSNSSVASATIASGSTTGSITLAVDQVATGSTQISSGTVASTNDIVASGNMLVGAGGAALGLTSISAGATLAAGAHTINVTQASAGASATASVSLAPSTTITSTNNQIDAVVNGNSLTINIAAGTYSATQLATAITQAASGSLSAAVNTSGVLTLATTQQGSTASLQVTGGSALASLGLASGPVTNGTDGVVEVDGVATTVNDIAASGSQVTLAAAGGTTVTAEITGGLQTGSMTAQNVGVGNGSLSAVVAAINGAGAGVTATALQVGTNQYALEVTSTATGTTGAATVDTQAFAASPLGDLTTTTGAQNAVVSVGGVGGYQITSATNTLSGLLPGVSVNVEQVSTTPVTISVAPDGTQIASQVATLVSAANQVLASIQTDSAYNASTKTAAPLNGQISMSILAQQVLAIVGNAVGSSSAGSDGTAGESAGLAITSSGTITFNQNAFEKAYNANPTAVQSMLIEGGTFAPSSSAYQGQVSVAGATNNTVPGQYAVVISQSAAQAVDLGSATFGAPASALASPESYTVTSGSQGATYHASAGESIAKVVSGLDGAFAAAGLSVSASLSGASGSYHLELTSADYGSAASFTVSASGTDQLGLTSSGATYSGTDVAGTIDGQSATGVGQILSLTNQSDPANGLTLQIATSGISMSTNVGIVNYNPGLAQRLANLAQTTISPTGQISVTLSGLNNTLSNVTSQIAQQQQLVNTQQATLTQEFTKMEQTLSQLKSISSFLTQSASSSSSGGLSSMSSSSSSSSTPSVG